MEAVAYDVVKILAVKIITLKFWVAKEAWETPSSNGT